MAGLWHCFADIIWDDIPNVSQLTFLFILVAGSTTKRQFQVVAVSLAFMGLQKANNVV